jgi:hypothetical protein
MASTAPSSGATRNTGETTTPCTDPYKAALKEHWNTNRQRTQGNAPQALEPATPKAAAIAAAVTNALANELVSGKTRYARNVGRLTCCLRPISNKNTNEAQSPNKTGEAGEHPNKVTPTQRSAQYLHTEEGAC